MIPEKDNLEALFISFLSGNSSESEREQVYSILSENEEAKKLLVDLSQVWDASGIISDSSVNTEQKYKKLSSRIRKNRGFYLKYQTIIKYAAIIILVFSIGAALSPYLFNIFSKQITESSNTKITSPLGSKTNLILPDGTEVWLNAGSYLSYSTNFGNFGERKVYLDGEAFFRVNKNRTKPFLVMAQGITIKALGTSFNVKAYNNEPDIFATLVEGKISVSGSNQTDQEVILEPNETIKIHKKDFDASGNTGIKAKSLEKENLANDEESPLEGVTISKNINTVLYTSWKDSEWIIENEELSSLAKKLERRYAVTIHFVDDKTAEMSFTGTLMEESLEQVLQIISFAAPLKYKVEGSNVYLERK